MDRGGRSVELSGGRVEGEGDGGGWMIKGKGEEEKGATQ